MNYRAEGHVVEQVHLRPGNWLPVDSETSLLAQRAVALRANADHLFGRPAFRWHENVVPWIVWKMRPAQQLA